jgi:hypothetical protein
MKVGPIRGLVTHEEILDVLRPFAEVANRAGKGPWYANETRPVFANDLGYARTVFLKLGGKLDE